MKRMLMGGMVVTLLISAMALAPAADVEIPSPGVPQESDGVVKNPVDAAALSRTQFLHQNADAQLYEHGDRIRRVYGTAFSTGQSAEHSAQQFIDQHIGMFGVKAEDLVARGPFPGMPERHVQPIMYLPDEDRYRFTGVYFDQHLGGLPVFRSRAVFLTRNDPGHPLVLVSADLRDLGGFELLAPELAAAEAATALARRSIAADLRIEPVFIGDAEVVVWAGVDDAPAQPRLALQQVAETGTIADGSAYDKWLYLVDALNGIVLHRERLVHNCGGGTISGNVNCIATEGDGAAICGDLIPLSMPYGRVVIGSGPGLIEAFADVNGNYQIEALTAPPINLSSGVRGQYFRVFNQAGSNTVVNEQVDLLPMFGVNFVHDAAPFPGADGEEHYLAAINAYYHSNIVRDYALSFNPSYPVIVGQTEFPVNVNINDNCNAFYNGNSINFFTSGGGCANTAFSAVVYHEYGHHLVGTAGSGQGAYGEGMSDCVTLLINDNPILGLGFHNNCSAGLRNADNSMQYPCSGPIHFCGQLISGCVWSTRTELSLTHPKTFRDIISNLTINSILLHTGSGIDPSITIDFLTLDDDDDTLLNGTPHYAQINAGFSAHNMDAPPLPPLYFQFPNGLPEIVAPGEETVIQVQVQEVAGSAEPGLAFVHYRFSVHDDFTEALMTEVSAGVYDAVLPATDCGTKPEFFFSAQDTDGGTTLSDTYVAPVGTSIVIAVEEDFEVAGEWIGSAPGDDATSGHWEWGDPVGTGTGGTQVQPGDCYVGEFCWFTGQHPVGGGLGANDVDNGTTTLRGPIFDLAGAADARISYQSWYSNHAGASPHVDTFVVDVSNDGGATWSNVEVVGPDGPETTGGWYGHEFLLSDILPPTDQVRLRFVASDFDPQALIEAAIDYVVVEAILCEAPEPPDCPADFDGSGDVGVPDVLALLGAWGSCDSCAEDIDGNGEVGVQDLLLLLGTWGKCDD